MGSARFTDGRVPDAGIRAIYHRRNKWQRYLDVEAALATAQARVGLIPTRAAEAITAAARIDRIDIDEVEHEIIRESHPPRAAGSCLGGGGRP